MTNRERVKRAMHYKSVDKVPVRFYYAPVGYYEHGDKLNDLYATLPGEFGPFQRMPVPQIPAEHFDSSGKYHAFLTDDWGTKWEYRIYGVAGIPTQRPLAAAEELDGYVLPPKAPTTGKELEEFKRAVAQHQANDYYSMIGCGNLFERMIALYGDENVLCDIALEEPEIARLADRIIEFDAAYVERAVKAGADAITFGDDYGTERALLMSPASWRAFFKPRLKELFAPAVKAGLDIHFHSCGQISDILEDMAEIGVTSIWPQIPAYNMKDLAARCKSLGLAVEVHTDRANTMTFGTPQQVKDLVAREYETFRMQDGGAWFYVEADNGFPYENIVALVEAIKQYR